MKNIGLSCIAVAALAGCSTVPTPQSRAEWNAVHTRTFPGQSEEAVLEAAEKTLRLADKDFRFDYPAGQLVATRNWLVYAGIAATSGTDYWTISTKATPEGIQATAQITRTMSAITPTPTFGSAGVNGMTATSTSTPGQPVQHAPPYDLFWMRVSYLLNPQGEWPTCDAFKAGKGRVDKASIDTLCSVTTADAHPNTQTKG